MKENHAFTIESAVPEDAEELVAIYDYYVQNTAITFEYETPTAAEFRRRIENTLSRFPYLVLRQSCCFGVIFFSSAFASFTFSRTSCLIEM